MNEIESIFSDKSIEKKLQTVLKDVASTHRLFIKLADVIDQYHRQGKADDDQQVDISKQLINFKHLIDESDRNPELISSLEDCLAAIREHYRIIRDDVQTLEKINEKIEKKLLGINKKDKIGRLIIRGIEEKIPNSIYFDPQESQAEKRQSIVLKQFFDHFFNYVPFIRELSENIFDNEHEYILKLEDLQAKLLHKQSANIKDYFLQMKSKLIQDNRSYSIQLLLQNFVRNPLVHINISNNSTFYYSQFIKLFQKLVKSNDQNYVESLITLIFHLNRITFLKFNSTIFQNTELIDFVFKSIYNQGLTLYSNSNSSKLQEHFLDLFHLILTTKSDLLDRLRDSIIDETNRNQTFHLLSNLYGQHVQCLKLNPLEIKYCFNYLFFKSLTYKQIDDVRTPSLFAQLLFYIHTYDNKIYPNNTENQHEQDLINLKNLFLQFYNEQNYIDLIEILKLFINIQTYDFRLQTTITILSNFNTNIKIETLKHFFQHTQSQTELYLRLIQSCQIHLLKDVFFQDLISIKSVENNYQIAMIILFKVFHCSTDDADLLNKEFINLLQLINQLTEFYNQKDHIDICQDLQRASIEYMLDGFSRGNEENLNEYVKIIIENLINYKFEYVIKIIELTKSKVDVLDLFQRIITRKDSDSLSDWANSMSKLDDQLYFLYCYYRYSKEQFDTWFKQLNPYVTIEENRKLIENNFQDNCEVFKYLQHNQVNALTLIYDYLENPLKNDEYLFMKIGAGQGKSLIIAETVRKIIEINQKSPRKVFVITCYDHLAKANFEKYQNYYKYFNIQSIYCSNESSTSDFARADVIYADLQTYFNVLRKDGLQCLMKSERIDLPDFSQAILIMDEFDSLILDFHQIFQVAYCFQLKNYNATIRLDHKDEIRKFFFDELFSNETKLKFAQVIDRWCEKLLSEKQEEDNKNVNRKFQDTLGREHTIAKSLLNGLLQESTANFVYFYLDPLVFYCKFKQVIGFSGSITFDGMDRLKKTLFENKNCLYYEIPPISGLLDLNNNRNKLGIVKKDTSDYLDAIQEEIKSRHTEQPILIFADLCKRSDQEKSDYEYIYEKLIEAKETFLKDSTIIRIVDSTDIKQNIHKIGRLGSITLATRIIARGVDIKIEKNIEKGLHVLLTYYPDTENIYIQMLDRIARYDEKGSYSEITRSPKKFVNIPEIKVDPLKKIYHDVTEYFYKNIPTDLRNTKNLTMKWNLFSCLMQHMSKTEIDQNDLIQFIETNIFNL